MATETASLRLPFLAADQAQKHVTHNEALLVLDALVQLSVKDRDATVPPASPGAGDRHIVGPAATGAWAGQAGKIAAWQDGAWAFFTPGEGWLAWVADVGLLLVHDGGIWSELAGGDALQNLSRLGIGTSADATNPFSAKLNKALWTAKTAAEGGDGDLRYTLNKETAADVLSLLFQAGFSGRLELGLIGDDNLTVKVSPDGSTWLTALLVDRTSGDVTFAGGLNLTAGTAGSRTLHVRGEGALIRAQASVGSASGPTFRCDKARETPGAEAVVQLNDVVGRFDWLAHTGSAFSTVGRFDVVVNEPTPGAGLLGCRMTLQVAPVGSAVVSEMLRLTHEAGIALRGASNVVIDQNRHFRLRSYTVATLPSASPAGQTIACSDLGGGAGQLCSDGARWRRASGGQQTIATDADLTLTPLASAEEQRHTGTLTADRTISLSATHAYPGARFRVARSGGGTFNLSLGGLKALATNTWAEAVHDGSAWHLSAHGAL